MKKNVEKKIMGNLVVKANSLINASFKLDLIEQRLIILAITEARETGTGITSDSSLTVHASKYTETFGGERQAAYKALKTAFEFEIVANPALSKDGNAQLEWIYKNSLYFEGSVGLYPIFRIL